jgi:hypothetical protein
MSTPVQKVSLGIALLSLAIGVFGLVLGSYGMYTGFVFGMLRVNIISNVIRLGLGIWGLASLRSPLAAEQYAQRAGIAYVVLSLLGFFAPTGFGQAPIGGHNIWVNGLMGLLLLYFGYGKLLAADDLKLE